MWNEQSRARHKGCEKKTKLYRSDLTDEEWSATEPFLPKPTGVGGPRRGDVREVLNAIRYLVRSGCPWAMLPIHFPSWQTVYWWFRRLARRTLFRTIHDVVPMIDRGQSGRAPEPTAAVIDSQTVKAPAPRAERGHDGNRRIVGRKRPIAVDADGRLLLIHLTPANVSDASRRRCWRMFDGARRTSGGARSRLPAVERFDRWYDSAGAQAVLDALPVKRPWIEHLFADSPYDRRQLMDKAPFWTSHWRSSKRTEPAFVVPPRRWVVERTLGWMTRHRRRVRDDEARIDVSEAMTDIAKRGLLTRRITHP